jgi:protein tyrosine/serine phosphatase
MTTLPAFEGIDNFRDFGGYPTRFGRPLRRGQLLRSASHGRATDADLEALESLGLAVVVDLRRKSERERDPSRRPPGFSGAVIVNDQEDNPDSWWAHVSTSDLSPESFRDYMLDYYRAAPFEARHIDLFQRYFAALESATGPILIHCAAGKDRTGLLAALTHHVACVGPEDIMADYLLTNAAARIEARTPHMTVMIEESIGRRPSEDWVRVALSVEAAYLETALAEITAAHGDLDAYLDRVIGLGGARRDALVARLLEPEATGVSGSRVPAA